MSIPPEVLFSYQVAQAGPGRCKWFYGWFHQTYFPKHLLSYNFLPRESLTFNLETHCFTLSSWIVTPFAKPVLAGSDRGLAHPKKSPKALSLSHNWHEAFTKRCLGTNNPFPLFNLHITKKQSISITRNRQYLWIMREPFGIKSTRIEERRMLSPSYTVAFWPKMLISHRIPSQKISTTWRACSRNLCS